MPGSETARGSAPPSVVVGPPLKPRHAATEVIARGLHVGFVSLYRKM
jgi:hypothetical protein